jgi:hypothetical protein
MNYQITLMKIFDAIQTDNYVAVQNVLRETLNNKVKLPSRELSGIVILAAESRAYRVAKEISRYNFFVRDSVVAKYIRIARKILSNNNKVTIH